MLHWNEIVPSLINKAPQNAYEQFAGIDSFIIIEQRFQISEYGIVALFFKFYDVIRCTTYDFA